MKASLSEYMKALSGDQFSILEEIIQHKYRKFMSFFDLINEYSDDIESMKYNFTDQNTLDIELSMKTKRSLKNELIEVMKHSKKICRHIHLPVQSGSNRILQRMNRRYTREQYLELVRKIRTAIPDISITTDIIVGFPGETVEDVDDTIALVREAQYDNAFTFI